MRKLLLVATMVGGVSCLADSGTGTAARTRDEAPAATSVSGEISSMPMEDLTGRRWTLETLRGRVVLLDFWATWCGPCLAELPRLKRLRNTYSRDDLAVIGVMIESSDKRTLVSWLNRHRIEWPQVHERNFSASLPRTYHVRSLPSTVLFRRDGSIDQRNLRGKRLEQRIAELLSDTHQ